MDIDDTTSPGTMLSKTTAMLSPLRLSSLLPVFIEWICITQVAALAVQKSPISTNQLTNVNGSLSAIPTEFEVQRLPQRGTPFENLGCFGLATNLLDIMARSDTSKPLPPREWAINGIHLELSLTGAPWSSHGVLTRYVIWGIYEAVKEMILADDFGSSTFLLQWQTKIVGCLTFSALPLLRIPSDNTMSNITQDLSPPSLSNNTSPLLLVDPSLNTNGLEAGEFSIQIFPRTPYTSLDPSGIFMNMLGLLVVAAEHPWIQMITSPFTVAVAEFSVQIAVTGPADGKPMTTRPLLLYGRLCIGLSRLSDWLLRTHNFGTFGVRLFIDETEIGWLFLGPRAGTTVLAAEE